MRYFHETIAVLPVYVVCRYVYNAHGCFFFEFLQQKIRSLIFMGYRASENLNTLLTTVIKFLQPNFCYRLLVFFSGILKLAESY